MPQGTLCCAPYCIWRSTTARYVSSSSVPGYARITSSGMKYSNIDALQDSSARAVPGGRERASELEPVLVRDLPDRDRDEARQPRLRGQRVVVRRVEPSVGDAEADREEPPLPVEQESELHFLDEVVGEPGEPRRPARSGLRLPCATARLRRAARARRSRPSSAVNACVDPVHQRARG